MCVPQHAKRDNVVDDLAEDDSEGDEDIDLDSLDTDDGDFEDDGAEINDEGEEDADSEIVGDDTGGYQQGGRKKTNIPLSATSRDWGKLVTKYSPSFLY